MIHLTNYIIIYTNLIHLKSFFFFLKAFHALIFLVTKAPCDISLHFYNFLLYNNNNNNDDEIEINVNNDN